MLRTPQQPNPRLSSDVDAVQIGQTPMYSGRSLDKELPIYCLLRARHRDKHGKHYVGDIPPKREMSHKL